MPTSTFVDTPPGYFSFRFLRNDDFFIQGDDTGDDFGDFEFPTALNKSLETALKLHGEEHFKSSTASDDFGDFSVDENENKKFNNFLKADDNRVNIFGGPARPDAAHPTETQSPAQTPSSNGKPSSFDADFSSDDDLTPEPHKPLHKAPSAHAEVVHTSSQASSNSGANKAADTGFEINHEIETGTVVEAGLMRNEDAIITEVETKGRIYFNFWSFLFSCCC